MTEWLKGKVKSFSAGASAILFEGNETAKGGKALFIPVNEPVRKLVLSGRWGAEIEYQLEKIKGQYGFEDTITAVKIIKEGPRTNYRKPQAGGDSRSAEDLIAIDCIKFAFQDIAITGGFQTAETKIATQTIIDIAKKYVTGINTISNEIKQLKKEGEEKVE